MTKGYAYDHAWTQERIRLAGLEAALDPGTRAHLLRLGVGPGSRCLEIGAGGGSVAFWLAERVAPGGTVVATDLETDFLESEATGHPRLEVLRHDIMAAALPTGFEVLGHRQAHRRLPRWHPEVTVGRLRDGDGLAQEHRRGSRGPAGRGRGHYVSARPRPGVVIYSSPKPTQSVVC
jgi:hypothetical protein